MGVGLEEGAALARYMYLVGLSSGLLGTCRGQRLGIRPLTRKSIAHSGVCAVVASLSSVAGSAIGGCGSQVRQLSFLAVLTEAMNGQRTHTWQRHILHLIGP